MSSNSRATWAVRRAAVAFLTFAVISSTALVVLYNTMAGGTDGSLREYEAEFTDVNGLRAGDDVRLAGVEVGDVTGIRIDGTVALVDFRLRDDVTLGEDVGLVLRYQNLIGQRYLAVVPGDPGAANLPPGAVIDVRHTSPGFDLTALLNGFRPLFAVLEPADINALAESVVKVLQGEGGTVDRLLSETTDLTNYLADQDEVFHQVAANLVPVLQDVAGQGAALEDTVTRLARLTSALSRDRRVFGTSVAHIGSLLQVAERIVERARRPLADDVAGLQRLLAVYAEHSDDYAKATPALARLLAALGRSTSYRSAINTFMCDVTIAAGDVEVPTTVAGTSRTELCR